MIYSTFDAGNFYVIPGSPAEALEADAFMALQKDNLRISMGYGPEDVIIAIVGSQFLYKGMWLGHAVVLQALSPLLADFPLSKDNSSAQLRIIVHSGELTNNYSVALEVCLFSFSFQILWSNSLFIAVYSVSSDDGTELEISKRDHRAYSWRSECRFCSQHGRCCDIWVLAGRAVFPRDFD